MTKEFCDICGRPIETYKNVSEFKLKKSSSHMARKLVGTTYRSQCLLERTV